MHIVELKRGTATLFLLDLTETTISFTANWREAKRFPVNELPKANDIEPYAHGAVVVGYPGV